ncbi:ATP-binding protein [Kribbella solani]|uniref:ATP-binding protein n=1 Tax=Kribbella solani TaxID=236067 RepID=UPI0029A39AFD|nr:ATP-binding protein [Kribbella solani]MDX2972354.1 ATP-binding protein [Kribbella solani]
MTVMEDNESGFVGRIKYIAAHEDVVYVELRSNGTVLTCDVDDPEEFAIGEIVLVGVQSMTVEKAPSEIWPEDPWIGIVRLVLKDEAVVAVGDRARAFPLPPGLELKAGNTVEGTDASGVIRVLSETPIRQIEVSLGDEIDISLFKTEPSGSPAFDDFGGSAEILARAAELIEVPLKYHDALVKINARPVKGVLFTGPSGTGKTMLARIIANQAHAQFYQIKGPEIVSKWLGASEELIRKVFEDARKQERAIIFFDELDSLAPQRSDDSHEATRRLVGQLLTEMDGFNKQQNIVVIATTNRPQDLDVALRRPGRFDWQIDFALPSEPDRQEILRASSKDLAVGDGLPLADIAANTDGWSAADLAAIWTEAALLAVVDERDVIMPEDCYGGYERVLKHKASIEASQHQGPSRSNARNGS